MAIIMLPNQSPSPNLYKVQSVYNILIYITLVATAEDGCGNFCCDKDGDVRLLDGRRESEGHVEVCLNGEWGTLCDDHWDNRNAGVICAMLGYHRESEYTAQHVSSLTVFFYSMSC